MLRLKKIKIKDVTYDAFVDGKNELLFIVSQHETKYSYFKAGNSSFAFEGFKTYKEYKDKLKINYSSSYYIKKDCIISVAEYRKIYNKDFKILSNKTGIIKLI